MYEVDFTFGPDHYSQVKEKPVWFDAKALLKGV
jgi:hypothetical protein